MGLVYNYNRSALILIVKLFAISRKSSSDALVSGVLAKVGNNLYISNKRGVKGFDQVISVVPSEQIAHLGGSTLKPRNMSTNELFSTANKDAEIDTGRSEPSDFNITTHYVFLIHGILGNDLEMKYIETAIEKSLAKDDIQSLNVNQSRLVVYRPNENNGMTKDGIAKGGARLTKEIEDFIRRDTAEQLKGDELSSISERHVSVSFVGNSLGGLYARYAASILPVVLDEDKTLPDTRVVIHRHVFCTTATPHLGVASHTFIPVPRFVEKFIGRLLSKTGKDLFRSDGISDNEDLIYDMSTNYEQFLLPLSKFQKRIAYANAFRTDFQVPTNTAAFLSEKSTYPHHPIDPSLFGKDDGEMKNGEENSFIVAMLTTEKNDDILKVKDDLKEKVKRSNSIRTMSNKIDALGWTKVFIDVRDKIPARGLSLPSKYVSNTRQRWRNFLQDKRSTSESYDDILVTSQDLARLMNGSETVNIPIGHQVMVANSKSETYSKMTANGKPVMDKLANDLVHDIFNVRKKGGSIK